MGYTMVSHTGIDQIYPLYCPLLPPSPLLPYFSTDFIGTEELIGGPTTFCL